MCPITWGINGLLILSGCIAMPTDVPEEVLRAEIYTHARSPVDGKKLTAQEYVLLQEDLANLESEPALSGDIRQIIQLLRLRQLLQRINPF